MNKQTRRQFILTTAAAGLVSAIPARASASRELIEGLNRAVGQQLDLSDLSSGTRDAVRISAVEKIPGHGIRQFVLHMEGTSDQQLPEGLYQACSESGDVDMTMHIMPAENNQYAAYFALVED
jgi:hypothetical protein